MKLHSGYLNGVIEKQL